ncbi:hypothetical protein BpHYR1_050115 [Brachionus plicatilis]|uniref:Uncharacterized protein n=1 Tax=Brachionus plicatilis TaxID=10195 RepID=A0A3M7RCW3_BRAPC|nr:hypothetical protein BpHYR1_050115 [Brachionus plicatilis]
MDGITLFKKLGRNIERSVTNNISYANLGKKKNFLLKNNKSPFLSLSLSALNLTSRRTDSSSDGSSSYCCSLSGRPYDLNKISSSL